mgnify:CR=1 FL=1
MVRIVKTEFYKLKRYHILWAGVALMLLSVLLTLFTSMANDGSVWDFAYLTEQVIKNNMSMIFPMCISLIAGYMISREQTDDTLKNILTVPISFKRLLTGKLIVCGVLSIIFGLICSLFTVIAEMIVGFPGFQISLALKATLQITAVNFFLYLAVLPIIIITCRKAGSFLIGVIIAFVYGYGGMFAAGNMTLANLYPITASLGMIGYRSYDTAVNWNILTCICSLAVIVVISAVLIICMKETEPKQAKKKAKKVNAKERVVKFMKKIFLSLILILIGVSTLSGCTKDEILNHYNNVVQSAGSIELTGKLSLQGKKEKGIDDYTGSYQADYENFSDTEYLFGGTSIKREAGKDISVTCTLEVLSGTAKVFWISGADEAVTLLETTGTYSDTITLPDGGNYIGIECENFTGKIEMNIE